MKIKQLILAASAVVPTLTMGSIAYAQTQPNVYAFGDSGRDIGNGCNFPGSVGGNCTNGQNIAQHFAAIAKYKVVGGGMVGVPGATDYAVGGTTVWPATPTGENYFAQIQTFAATGARIGPNDVTFISAGQNEQVQYTVNADFGRQTALNVAAGVGQLIGLGGRGFVVFGGIPLDRYFTAFGIPLNPGSDYTGYQKSLQSSLPAALAPYAAPGIQIRYLDFYTMFTRVIDNPGLYGFKAGDCLQQSNCLSLSMSLQNQYGTFNTHPSDAFALILSRYINNLMHAQDELPAQGDVTLGVAANFSNGLFSRIDSYRSFGAYGLGPTYAMAYAMADGGRASRMPQKAIRMSPAIENPWSAYIEGGAAGGTRDDRTVQGGASRGYDYQLPDGKAGLEYAVNPNIRVGAAFGYSRANVDFNGTAALSGGHLVVDTPQIGIYASTTYPNWFTDFVAAYGHNKLDISRPGVIDTIYGNTDGNSYSVAFKSGYLFDVGTVRVGPVGGLQYLNSHVNAYTEAGDAVLTQFVRSQNVSSLIGSLGMQLRVPFVVSKIVYSPYLNVTAEHDFIGTGRTIVAAQTDALALPIYSIVPNSSNTYGKVVAGLAAQLKDSVSVNINGSATFARAGSEDYAVSGGIKVAF